MAILIVSDKSTGIQAKETTNINKKQQELQKAEPLIKRSPPLTCPKIFMLLKSSFLNSLRSSCSAFSFSFGLILAIKRRNFSFSTSVSTFLFEANFRTSSNEKLIVFDFLVLASIFGFSSSQIFNKNFSSKECPDSETFSTPTAASAEESSISLTSSLLPFDDFFSKNEILKLPDFISVPFEDLPSIVTRFFLRH